MGFKDIIKANNEARGHTGDPYAYLVIDEEYGFIAFHAVRQFMGESDHFSGSQPLVGKDLNTEFQYVFDMLTTWGRSEDGVWFEYTHFPTEGSFAPIQKAV